MSQISEVQKVLALKYRPEKFEDLVGQSSISTTLSEAIKKDRLSHAYLFSGLRGSGKTSTARIFSKALICTKRTGASPCLECEDCLMAKDNHHSDIIEMDAASNRKIDDIRELIEHTKYRPTIAKYKIFIIDEVHMLTKEAFNALLKTLEEPPKFVKFILATTDPLKLPATILSRTQHFRFKKISKEDVLNHLIHILNEERVDYQKEALEIIARSGGGSLRDTLTLLDQAIVFSKDSIDVDTVTSMLGLIDPAFIEETFNYILERDYKNIKLVIKELENYEAEMVIDELIIFLKEQIDKDSLKFSTLIIDRFFRILSDGKILLSMNADGGFVLTLTFFKMMESLKVRDIDSMIEELESNINLKQKNFKPKVQNNSENIENIKNIESVKPKEPTSTDLFQKLIERIDSENSNLGDCFRENIKYIEYRDNILFWESSATMECKDILKDNYAKIKQFVKELFGINTKIKLPYKKDIKSKEDKNIKNIDKNREIEDGGESCIANVLGVDTKSEVENIVETSLIKKARELFRVTQTRVIQKV